MPIYRVSSAIVVPRRIYQAFISALPWQLFRITVKTDKCLINPPCDNSSTKKSVDGHLERQDGSLFGKLGSNPFIFLKIKASNFNPYFYAPARSIEELLNELFTHFQFDDASFTDRGGQLLLIRLKHRDESRPNMTIEIFAGPNTTRPCYGNPPHGFSHLRDLVNADATPCSWMF